MPVVKEIKKLENENFDNTIKLSKLNNNNDDIYNEILKEIIYTKSSLLNTVQSSFILNNKESNASKEALVGEIKRLCKNKAEIYSFDEEAMSKRIMNFLLGYGILQDLIENDDISDIDFTRYNNCIIKKNGVKEKFDISFMNDEEFKNFSTLMIVRNGGIINADENHRRESDERYRLRINVAIPPRNVTGTSLIIRKHRMHPYDLEELVNLKMLSKKEGEYLKNSFKQGKKNTLFIGKGASGKTTLLRACLMHTNPLQNYLVCEKDTELYLDDFPNFIIQRIKKSTDGGKSVTLKDLVNDGLTMSVSGMVVGELVGDEAYDFLTAGYTDHVIYGTLHSSGIENIPERLSTMIDTGKRMLNNNVLNNIISGAIEDIVYLEDFKIKEIKKIKKIEGEIKFVDIKKKIEEGEIYD